MKSVCQARLRELGITAATPTEFIEKAKGIVCSHNTLKDKSSSLQEEIRRLEQEQEHLIQAKEKELLEQAGFLLLFIPYTSNLLDTLISRSFIKYA